MPWEVVTAMEQRERFIEALGHPDSPGMAALCREFGISRKSGYKWLTRYREQGQGGLADLSRAPHSHPNALSEEVEQLIIAARTAHPSWGAKKLLPWLEVKHPRRKLWPCLATISAVLERQQLSEPRKNRRHVAPFGEKLSAAEVPNQLWCIDHKGWWLAGNGDKCEPFTVTDQHTRYLIRCSLSAGKGVDYVRPLMQAAFREFGLPVAIRSDNGPPFASRAPLGLCELSVWFMRLGIYHERIEVGKPQQNGRHERMHLTMQCDRVGPVGASMRQEQKRLNAWREEFNYERPHEALNFKTPASHYSSSPRPMPRRVPEFEYSLALRKRKVDICGKISWNGRDLFTTEALRGQWLGLQAGDTDAIWSLWLGEMLLGSFDEKRHELKWADKLKRRSQMEEPA
jgi:putative transposase